MLKKLLAAAVVLVAFGTGSAHADTVAVVPDGSWYHFDVDIDQSELGGLEWINVAGEARSFTFTTTTSVLLTIVDGGFGGDQYEVFDNGSLLGLTTAGLNSYPDSVGLNFDVALGSESYGRAFFALGAGTHTITGRLVISALDDFGDALNATVGALRVTPVPLPASALLLLSGSGLLGFLGVRRRRAAIWA